MTQHPLRVSFAASAHRTTEPVSRTDLTDTVLWASGLAVTPLNRHMAERCGEVFDIVEIEEEKLVTKQGHYSEYAYIIHSGECILSGTVAFGRGTWLALSSVKFNHPEPFSVRVSSTKAVLLRIHRNSFSSSLNSMIHDRIGLRYRDCSRILYEAVNRKPLKLDIANPMT